MSTIQFDKEFLSRREREIRKDYKRVVPNTMRRDAATNKLTVEIQCKCGNKRRVATSDLFQVSKCHDCTKASRAKMRTKRRKAKAS